MISVFTTFNYGGFFAAVGTLGLTAGDWIVLALAVLLLWLYDWKREAAAPSDPDALLELTLDLTARKARAQYQYIPAQCLFCGRVLYLGLREEEMEGYRRYREDGADLEDVLPALNAFEREFLITGMCPDCQCDVFRKELPADTRRWALSEGE